MSSRGHTQLSARGGWIFFLRPKVFILLTLYIVQHWRFSATCTAALAKAEWLNIVIPATGLPLQCYTFTSYKNRSQMSLLLLLIYIGWLALRWPLVKHLDGLWLIFLDARHKQAIKQANFQSCTANSIWWGSLRLAQQWSKQVGYTRRWPTGIKFPQIVQLWRSLNSTKFHCHWLLRIEW